jgi:hypothetical protein
MPELLEESIAEVKEQTADVADSAESSSLAVAAETQVEPVIECRESTPESCDKLESPVASDSVSESAMVADPVAVLDEPVAVVADPVAVLEEPVAVVEEPVAVLEQPAAAGPEETGAVHDEPCAEHAAFGCTSEAPVLAHESIEIPAIEEPAAVLEEPMAESADQCSVEATAEGDLVANEVAESNA